MRQQNLPVPLTGVAAMLKFNAHGRRRRLLAISAYGSRALLPLLYDRRSKNAIMPLPPSPLRRELKHTRNIQIDIFSREDQLWDVDARFTEVKTYDLSLRSFTIPAGRPVHDFWLRLTIDIKSTIVGVIAVFDQEPFAGHCRRIHADYQKLIGLILLKGFRIGLRERLSGVDGCTHMNELAEVLPYAVVQAFAFSEADTRKKAGFESEHSRPIELDGCHALRSDGPVAAEFYPRWATRPKAEA